MPDAGRIVRNGADRMVHDGTSLNSNASSTASSRAANMADMCLIHSTVQGTTESAEECFEMQKFKVPLAETAEPTPSSGLQHPASNPCRN